MSLSLVCTVNKENQYLTSCLIDISILTDTVDIST